MEPGKPSQTPRMASLISFGGRTIVSFPGGSFLCALPAALSESARTRSDKKNANNKREQRAPQGKGRKGPAVLRVSVVCGYAPRTVGTGLRITGTRRVLSRARCHVTRRPAAIGRPAGVYKRVRRRSPVRCQCKGCKVPRGCVFFVGLQLLAVLAGARSYGLRRAWFLSCLSLLLLHLRPLFFFFSRSVLPFSFSAPRTPKFCPQFGHRIWLYFSGREGCFTFDERNVSIGV